MTQTLPHLAASRALRLMDPKVAEILRFDPKEARVGGGHSGGGRWRKLSDIVTDALTKWDRKGDNPLMSYQRPQLLTVAKGLGIKPHRGATEYELRDMIHAHVMGHPAKTSPEPPARIAAAKSRSAAKKATPSGSLSADPQVRAAQVEQRVADAYGRVMARKANPAANSWVSLADLRDELGSDIPRDDVDEALRVLNRTPAARVVPESNQKVLDSRDWDASVEIGNQPKHLIAMETPDSLRRDARRERSMGDSLGRADQLEAQATQIEEEAKARHALIASATPVKAAAAKKAAPKRVTAADRKSALEDLHAAGGQSSHADATPATLDALERDGLIRREGHVVHLTDAGKGELARLQAPKRATPRAATKPAVASQLGTSPPRPAAVFSTDPKIRDAAIAELDRQAAEVAAAIKTEAKKANPPTPTPPAKAPTKRYESRRVAGQWGVWAVDQDGNARLVEPMPSESTANRRAGYLEAAKPTPRAATKVAAGRAPKAPRPNPATVRAQLLDLPPGERKAYLEGLGLSQAQANALAKEFGARQTRISADATLDNIVKHFDPPAAPSPAADVPAIPESGPLKRIRPEVDQSAGEGPRERPNADEPLRLGRGQMSGTGNMHADSNMGQLWNDLYRDDRASNSTLNEIARLATSMSQGDRSFGEVLANLRRLADDQTDATVKKRILRTVDDIDAPAFEMPTLPDSTPEPLRRMVEDLGKIPTARRRGVMGTSGRDKSVIDDLVDAIGRIDRNEGDHFANQRALEGHPLHESRDGATQIWKIFDQYGPLGDRESYKAVRLWMRDRDRVARELVTTPPSPAATKVAAAKRAPRVAKPPAPSREELTAMASRDTARAALEGLTMAQLRAIDPAAGRMAKNKADLVRLIVESTAGQRLDSRAIRGDATLPYGERSRLTGDVDIVRADYSTPTGAMLALVPSDEDAQRLAAAGGEDPGQLHATLLLLGDAVDISPDDRASLLDAARTVADSLGGPVEAEGFALSLFNPDGEDPCIVLGLTGGELADAHTLATDEVDNVVDLPDQHEPWAAHVTLEYTDDASKISDLADRTGPITFDRLRLAFADEVHDIPLSPEVGRSTTFSDAPWSQFTQADYSPEQWRKACLIHEDPAEGQDQYAKSLCKLPVAEPGGTLNRNGIHAAAGRLYAVDAPADVKQEAAKKLVSLYRQMEDDPPDSLLSLAGVSRAQYLDDEEILRYAASSTWTKQDEDKHPRGSGPQGGQFVPKDAAKKAPAASHGPPKRPPPRQRTGPGQKPTTTKPPHPTKGQTVDKYNPKAGDRSHPKRRTLLPGEGVGRKGGDPDVRGLQQALNTLGLANLRPNGVYGDATEAAVMEAQKRLGLRPNGRVSSSLLRKLGDAAKLSNCAQRSEPADGIEDVYRAMSTANLPTPMKNMSAEHMGHAYGEPLDEVEFTVGASVCAYPNHVSVKVDDSERARLTPDDARQLADAVDNANETWAHVGTVSVNTDPTGDTQVRFGGEHDDGLDLDPEEEAPALAEGLRDMAAAVEEHEPGGYQTRSAVDYYIDGAGRDEWLTSATPWAVLQDRLEPELGTLASIEMATRCVVDTYTGGDRG